MGLTKHYCTCGNTMDRESKMCWECHLQKLKENKKSKEHFLAYQRTYAKKWRQENPDQYQSQRTDKCTCGNTKCKVAKMCLDCLRIQKKENRRTKEQIASRMKVYSKGYRERERDKIREAGRKYDTKYRENLSDKYVKRVIHQSSGVPRNLIPQELIELQRSYLKLYRTLKERHENDNTSKND